MVVGSNPVAVTFFVRLFLALLSLLQLFTYLYYYCVHVIVLQHCKLFDKKMAKQNLLTRQKGGPGSGVGVTKFDKGEN